MPRYVVKLSRESVIPLVIREKAEVEVNAENGGQAEEKALRAARRDEVSWHMDGHRTDAEMTKSASVDDIRELHHKGDGHGSAH